MLHTYLKDQLLLTNDLYKTLLSSLRFQLRIKSNWLNILMVITMLMTIAISILLAVDMIHFKALWCLGLCILFWFISPRDSKAESISLYFMLVFFSFTFYYYHVNVITSIIATYFIINIIKRNYVFVRRSI